MNKHVVVPALGLVLVGATSLTACSGGSTTRPAASVPHVSPSVTPQAGSPAASTPPASTPAASPSSVASAPSTTTAAPAPTGDAAASAVAAAAGGAATFPSSCDRTDTREVPVHLHGGKATLPHGSQLELDDNVLVTKNVSLQDGHTYRLVTLDCLPPAGASHSQLFVFRADPGTTPRLLGEPIKVADQVRITTTGEQDHEGLVVSAEGWSAKAPGCCPDQSLTYFMTVTAGGVVTAPPYVQPLTR